MALIDLIKLDQISDSVLVQKFSSEKKWEIRLGSRLVVNPGQEAIFVKEGIILDLFTPGAYTISTANIPLLDNLVNGIYGDTPFTTEVWFINKTVKRDIPWGTSSRIPILDAKFNFLVNIGAFGQWGMQIKDSRAFMSHLVGAQLIADTNRIESYFSGEIIENFSNILTQYIIEHKISLIEINAKLTELSNLVTKNISEEFNAFGIDIVNFNINNISIPDREISLIQSLMSKRLEMEMLSNTSVSQGYIAAKSFEVMQKAAENNNGVVGAAMSGAIGLGLGVGAGLPMGSNIASQMNISSNDSEDYVVSLQKLKKLFDTGLIEEEEYKAKKKEILDANF